MRSVLTVVFAWLVAGSAAAQSPVDSARWLALFEAYPHAKVIDQRTEQVRDMEVGLGALQKVRGAWRFKHAERFTGELYRTTWQILDGFSSTEVFEDLDQRLLAQDGIEAAFHCEGRSCGPSVQWANRVFRQRLLYGRDDTQLYTVYAVAGEPAWRLVLYASGRTADRQYLHLDMLRVAAPAQ